MLAPQNTDLPASWKRPGVYFKLVLSGSGASLANVAKRLVIVACKTSTGSKPTDQPFRALSQADANTWSGQASSASRMYAAALSQAGGGVMDVYLLLISEPTNGTAATRTITFEGPATSQGGVDLFICGYRISVQIANGDTANAIAANAAAAINLNGDIPVTAAANNAVVTLTYKEK